MTAVFVPQYGVSLLNVQGFDLFLEKWARQNNTPLLPTATAEAPCETLWRFGDNAIARNRFRQIYNQLCAYYRASGSTPTLLPRREMHSAMLMFFLRHLQSDDDVPSRKRRYEDEQQQPHHRRRLEPHSNFSDIEWKKLQVAARKQLHVAVLGNDCDAIRAIANEWREQDSATRRLTFCAVEWALRRLCKQTLPQSVERLRRARAQRVDTVQTVLHCFAPMRLCSSLATMQRCAGARAQQKRAQFRCIRQHLLHIITDSDDTFLSDFLHTCACECNQLK